MPTLSVTDFNIVSATAGGFILLFGLVSYLLKERFYLSEPLVATVWGIIFSPHAANWIRPLDYALGSQENLDSITLYFTRLCLGVQLVIAGIQLPSRYLLKEWKSLAFLLGPGMCGMWICTSLLVWGLVPNISFLHSLAVAACVTPTDPVLSNSIVKGKFADKNIPQKLQRLVIAESGANDGLGYPFLLLPLYLMKYAGSGGNPGTHGLGQTGGAGHAMAYWFGETWGYTIVLSIIYGAVVGWVAKEALHWAEERKYVDRESFIVFALALALFITGTCGMIGSDDVLACFIAGNTFTWDDWFRLETIDDSLQPTIDMILNIAVFLWFGAICPWYDFAHNDVIPIYRLIFLGILVLLFRRLPIVFAMHWKIHQIEEPRQALFVGFFGPIGVSAIFYLYLSLEFLNLIEVDGEVRPDAAHLADVMTVVIWFLVICSIFVHGLSVPLGKLGFYLPRTLSNAVSSERADEPESFHVRDHAMQAEHAVEAGLHGENNKRASQDKERMSNAFPRPLYRIGRSLIPSKSDSKPGTPRDRSTADLRTPGTEMSGYSSDSPKGQDMPNALGKKETDGISDTVPLQSPATIPRTIRFNDEPPSATRSRPQSPKPSV